MNPKEVVGGATLHDARVLFARKRVSLRLILFSIFLRTSSEYTDLLSRNGLSLRAKLN
jgi:hypothetical protein